VLFSVIAITFDPTPPLRIAALEPVLVIVPVLFTEPLRVVAPAPAKLIFPTLLPMALEILIAPVPDCEVDASDLPIVKFPVLLIAPLEIAIVAADESAIKRFPVPVIPPVRVRACVLVLPTVRAVFAIMIAGAMVVVPLPPPVFVVPIKAFDPPRGLVSPPVLSIVKEKAPPDVIDHGWWLLAFVICPIVTLRFSDVDGAPAVVAL
jgi:hypothetical protein